MRGENGCGFLEIRPDRGDFEISAAIAPYPYDRCKTFPGVALGTEQNGCACRWGDSGWAGGTVPRKGVVGHCRTF